MREAMSEWKRCPKCECMNLNRESCVDCGRELEDVEAMSTEQNTQRPNSPFDRAMAQHAMNTQMQPPPETGAKCEHEIESDGESLGCIHCGKTAEEIAPETGAVDVNFVERFVHQFCVNWEIRNTETEEAIVRMVKANRNDKRISQLEQENERLKSNPSRGCSCVFCKATIWLKEAMITDERGTYHPICGVLNRAEAAEQRVKELQSEYDEFKQAALTLTTINSIQLAMKVKS